MIFPEEYKPEIYEYLKKKQKITADYATFDQHVKVFDTPHGVYIEIHMTEDERTHMLNQLLNVTSDNLVGYKNAVEWWVMKNNRVAYIKHLDKYILIDTIMLDMFHL